MSEAATTDPGFGNVVRQMNKMMDQLQKGFYSFCPNETWTPAVNLYETDDTYLVCVDLAGVDKDKIELVVAENQLRLRGQRPAPVPPEVTGKSTTPPIRVHLMEIDHGTFCREVELPNDTDQERIKAHYVNGMLWIELPKR